MVQALVTLLQNLSNTNISTETILRTCLVNKRLAQLCQTDQVWIQLLQRDYNFDYYNYSLFSLNAPILGFCDYNRDSPKDTYTQLLIEQIIEELEDVHKVYRRIIEELENVHKFYRRIELEKTKSRENFLSDLRKLFFTNRPPRSQGICINNIIVPQMLLNDITDVIRNDPNNINPGSVLALLIYYNYLVQEKSRLQKKENIIYMA